MPQLTTSFVTISSSLLHRLPRSQHGRAAQPSSDVSLDPSSVLGIVVTYAWKMSSSCTKLCAGHSLHHLRMAETGVLFISLNPTTSKPCKPPTQWLLVAVDQHPVSQALSTNHWTSDPEPHIPSLHANNSWTSFPSECSAK